MTSSSDVYYWGKILQQSTNLKNWIELNFREIVEETSLPWDEGLEVLKANDFLKELRGLRSTGQWDNYTGNFLDGEIKKMESSTSGALNYCQSLFKNLERIELVRKESVPGPSSAKNPRFENASAQSNHLDFRTIFHQEIENIKVQINCWNNNQRLKEQQFTTALSCKETLDEIELMVKTLVEKHWNYVLQDSDAKNAIFNLIESLFVVSIQPMQQHYRRILRYNQKFKSEVRFLFPRDYIASGTKPTVEVQIINQRKARVFKEKELQNNIAFLDGNGHLEATLAPKLPATKPEKLDKGQANLTTVHDENFWARYTLTVQLRGLESDPREVFLVSFPLKIIGNSSQNMGALETLIWGNAAKVFDVVLIEHRLQKLPFADVKNAINAAMMLYGREFKQSDFTRVVRKVLGAQALNTILKSEEITFEQYRSAQDVDGLQLFDAKNKPITKISFWGWFYYLMEFISEHLCPKASKPEFGPWWMENKVIGYITNEESLELLRTCPEHTVLIRFSNTKPDAVTLEWIANSKLYSYRATTAELKERSLLNRVMDIEQWRYVYPDEDKNSLFRNFYPSSSSSTVFSHGSHERNLIIQPRNVRRYGYVPGHVKAYLEIPNDSPLHTSFFET